MTYLEQAQSAFGEAQDRVASLKSEQARFEGDLREAETLERELLSAHGDIDALTTANNRATTARKYLAKLEGAIAQGRTDLSAAEGSLRREQVLAAMAQTAGEGQTAEAEFQAALADLEGVIAPHRERLMEIFGEVETLASTYRAQSQHLGKGQHLEAELVGRGVSVSAVTQTLEPDASAPDAWQVFAITRARRAQAAAQAAAQATAQSKPKPKYRDDTDMVGQVTFASRYSSRVQDTLSDAGINILGSQPTTIQPDGSREPLECLTIAVWQRDFEAARLKIIRALPEHAEIIGIPDPNAY